MDDVIKDLKGCRLCADRFAATATQHSPNPIVWFQPGARLLIASQAPGMRVHQANTPFWDQSGKRLRDWLGLDETAFYDRSRVAIVPMAFCFPGYNAAGSDLPPPPICARTWRGRVMAGLKDIKLTILIGGYAQKYHLEAPGNVTETVASWRDHGPGVIPLPHPSWRNTAWLKKNSWFERDLLPVLRARVKKVMNDTDNAA
ncbi:uracil-DNA glycosylase family protein [Parasulfitobacter algicola]|uniref:Uracil-DNA glycosylase family protein n=1 Tax=Parasulfitobacter algicola TaxID=2614809 RepID=A0ABX2IMJ2_9RHOB|nr:uracil-DNA glycosylase family protein [Sulfitobacter algicola]NSX54102.1 uracil-DNA glycosylase family protein [Sulfitobacter algicola]